MLFLVEVMKAIFLVSVLLELGGHPGIILVICSRPILIGSSTLTLYISTHVTTFSSPGGWAFVAGGSM